MGCPHTNFRQGQGCLLILRDGRKLENVKFYQRKGRFVEFYDIGKFKTSEIRAISIWRGQARATP